MDGGAEALENTLAATTAELAVARATIATLQEQLAQLQSVVDKLQRKVFGQRSEKMPPVAEELRRKGGAVADPEAALARRRENAEKKKALPARETLHRIPEDKKHCPRCGGIFKPLGPGRKTTIDEHVPPTFERQVHTQEVARCQCGDTILTAEGPPKVFEKAGYGPGFLARLMVSSVRTRSRSPGSRSSTGAPASPQPLDAHRPLPPDG